MSVSAAGGGELEGPSHTPFKRGWTPLTRISDREEEEGRCERREATQSA